jgi:hypothetical protein
MCEFCISWHVWPAFANYCTERGQIRSKCSALESKSNHKIISATSFDPHFVFVLLICVYCLHLFDDCLPKIAPV